MRSTVAETLTRSKRSRQGKVVDPRERELKRLNLSVCDDTGFRLLLATYDQPKRRDELIARIVSEAEAKNVLVTRLDLDQRGPETNLVGLLRTHVADTHLSSGWRQAVMVIGIEQRLNYAAGPEGFAFLRQANLLRDALPQAAPVPVVLWLSRMASAALPAEAPDLWHWRAANFDFTGDEAPRLELLRELTTLRPEATGSLSAEQRNTRIQMLEDLLAELEREGPPRSKGRRAEQANLLFELGIENWYLQRAAKAVLHFNKALKIFREIGNRLGEATTLNDLGNAYVTLDEPRRAIEHFEQALKIAQEIGDRRGEGNALHNLGNAYAGLGETGRAIEHFEQALKIAREIGDRRGQGISLGLLANAYLALEEPRRAFELFEQSLQLAREIDDRRGQGIMLGNLGVACAELGELRPALKHFEEALKIAHEIGDRLGEGNAYGNLGVGYQILGEPRRAIEYFEQTLAIAREIRDRRLEGLSLFDGALSFDQLGERDEAIKRMEEALRIFKQIEDPKKRTAHAKLAEWQAESGDG
jgi:tetratricopeptide (TPR) repeat protein